MIHKVAFQIKIDSIKLKVCKVTKIIEKYVEWNGTPCEQENLVNFLSVISFTKVE